MRATILFDPRVRHARADAPVKALDATELALFAIDVTEPQQKHASHRLQRGRLAPRNDPLKAIPPRRLAGFFGRESTNGVSLDLIGIQKRSVGRSAKHGGELPREIVDLRNSGIGALTTPRRHLMRRIAGQKNPPGTESVRNADRRLPRQDSQDFDLRGRNAERRARELRAPFRREILW